MDITHLNDGEAFTAKLLANKYIAESAQRAACLRMTVFANRERTQPAATITADDLADMARNPRVGPKTSAPVIAPHSGNGKKKSDAEVGLFSVLVVDHDDGDTDRNDIATYYAGTAYIAFTTSSHYQDGKGERWKVVLPLGEPLDAATWNTLAMGAADIMGGDEAQARINQIFVAPNKVSDDAPYEWLIDLDSPLLAIDDALGEQFMDAGREIMARQQEQARSAPVKGSGGSTPFFKRINGSIDIAEVLERGGYTPVGDRWLSPYSESGTAGVVLLTDGDKPRLYSFHGTDDPLSALNHGNHALDALDVVTVLEHNGDAASARDAYARGASELKSAASALTDESEQDEIDAIIDEARTLPATQYERVLKIIKSKTGDTLGALRSRIKEITPEYDDDDPDHLALARRAIKRIGNENVFSAQAHVWRWDSRGVWQKAEERAVRGWVQSSVDGEQDVSKALVDSVTDLFKTETFKPEQKFDIGPDETVNTPTGEIVLQDGNWTLTPHHRENYRTTQSPVPYDPAAQAPRFCQFLAEIFPGAARLDQAAALMEMVGYTLMAHCRHEKFVMLVGNGANGKSKVLDVVEGLCGEPNVAGVQPAQFGNRFQRAHLHTKLANIVSEIKQGEVIDDAALKAISSGEPTTVEHKFRDPFQMRPFATCWFGTNHMPHTRDFSDALFRRTLILKFDAKFVEGTPECDPNLKEKLLGELPGIMNLALSAYAKALKVGFTVPDSSREALKEWRLEADQVQQFVEDACTRDPAAEVGASRLYDGYKMWAADNGVHRTVSAKSFRDRLTRLGFGARRTMYGRSVTGLVLECTAPNYLAAKTGTA